MAGLTVFALISRAEAIDQRQLAKRRTATAERTVEFVQGMFQTADPSEARGLTITAREIVDRGAAKLDTPALKREPMVRAELGVTLSQVYGALGLYRKSDALIRRTFAIQHHEPATLARQLEALGQSQLRLGDYKAAEATFRRALAQSRTASDVLRARILNGLGQSLSFLEHYDEANRAFGNALRIDRARGEAGARDVAQDLEGIGNNLYDSGQADGARPFILEAIALRTRYEGPNSPSVSDGLNTLGEIAYSHHDLRAAEKYFRGNVAVDEQVLGADHPDHAKTLNNLARTLIEQQRYREAVPLLERAIAIAEPERGEAHDTMAFFYSNLAIARRHMGRLSEAKTLFEKAIAAARATGHRSLGPTLADLAELRCASGRAKEGLALLGEAKRATAADYPDRPWRSAWVENIRGLCLVRSGNAADGKAAIARSAPVITAEWPAGTLFAAEAKARMR